jgi:DNA-binding CsgD family transcriptional regulator
MAGVVGRDAELGAIERFLDDARARFTALVLEGEPGIGKTTVWREATRRAEERGYRVLSCRPVQAEATLAFASLGDLLAPVGEATVAMLPEPQRVALEVALLQRPASGAVADRRTVGAALTSLLTRLAADAPLLVAIDDVQWLDRPSAAALAFALRRLAQRPVAVLVAERLEHGGAADALGLDLHVAERTERLRLGRLTLSGIYHVLHERLGRVFPRPLLQRVMEASGGNPLWALEIARALDEADVRPSPGEPLPVPSGLTALLRDRVGRLPAPSREALLVVALTAEPSPDLVERALRRPVTDALERALTAGVVELRGEGIRFSHPLLAAAVSSVTLPERRRALHQRLADLMDDPEQRARHMALGAEAPDETVAAQLEVAAAQALRRGAPEASAELLALACQLTPHQRSDDLARRQLQHAEAVYRAGDTDEAERLLRDLIEHGPPGVLRARALELDARLLWVNGSGDEPAARCLQGLAEAGDDVATRARLYALLAVVASDAVDASRYARAARTLLDELDDPDPEVLAQTLLAFITAEFNLGHGLPSAEVEQALALERVAPVPSVADRTSAALGALLKYAGDYDGARHWLEATYRAAIEEGDEGSLPYAVSHFPQLELWTGHWAEAERWALEHVELAQRTGQQSQRWQALFNVAFVHAHAGQTEEARRAAEEALAVGDAIGDRWALPPVCGVLGFVELSVGEHARAVEQFARAERVREELGVRDPWRGAEDYVEALVAAGEFDTAERVTDELEDRARAFAWPTAIAPALRCRALLVAARGHLDDAVVALEEALAQHERALVPFSLARTLLVVGQVRRRRRERGAAKAALERAHALFSELGAPLWAARASAELQRVAIRRGTGAALTPTEQRVAELAAQGRTNREVAEALFISAKTVEANLSRVYRKLGIRSRAELGAKMATRPASGERLET